MVVYDISNGTAVLRAPGAASRFTWGQSGQYAWVSRNDGIAEVPFLAEVEPSRRSYTPPAKLHLQFARLANHAPAKTLTEIQRFAHKYGPLGVAQVIPADPRVGKFAPFLPKHAGQSLAEPLGRWWRQAREMRNLLGLAGKLGSHGQLEGYLRWGQMTFHPQGTTIAGSENRAFLTVQHTAFKPAPPVFGLQVNDCDIIAGEFLKRDNVQAALSLMGAQLDLALSQWVEVRAGFAEGQLRVERRPKNLLGFLWLGLADDLAAKVSKVRTCPSCGRFFSARGSRCLDCR